MTEPIHTNEAPTPAGHYSQTVVHGGLIFVSGQLPTHPVTGERQLGTIEDQTLQTLQNVAAILGAAGAELSDVLKVTIYISDIGLWDKVNAVYAEFFGEHRPARSVIPARELHFGFQIEMEVIAALKG